MQVHTQASLSASTTVLSFVGTARTVAPCPDPSEQECHTHTHSQSHIHKHPQGGRQGEGTRRSQRGRTSLSKGDSAPTEVGRLNGPLRVSAARPEQVWLRTCLSATSTSKLQGGDDRRIVANRAGVTVPLGRARHRGWRKLEC